jgi:hypothetical protein
MHCSSPDRPLRAPLSLLRETWSNRLETFAAIIILFPALILVLATGGFMVGVPLQQGYPVAAGLGCAIVAYFLCHRNTRESISVLFAAAGVVGIGLGWGTLFFDLSFDGLYYHQGAIAELSHGWNPWRTAPSGEFHNWTVWAEFYPKGIWIQAALANIIFGNIDAGRWINFLILVATSAAVFSVLLRSTRASLPIAAITTLLVCANPVTLTQFNTFYVDGLVGSLVTLMLCALWLVVQHRRSRAWWILGPALLLLLNTKQTGVVYGVILCSFALLATIWQRGWRSGLHLGAPLLLIGIIGIGWCGFSPYGKNLTAGLHVFHPLLGEHKLEMEAARRPPNLPHNRIGAFVLSQSARSAHPSHAAKLATWKFPLAINANELSPWVSPDVKTGGFGPWYGALLLGSLGGGIAMVIGRRWRRLKVTLALGFSVTLMVICHDLCWWARYVPQGWLLVWIVPIATLDLPGKLWRRWRGTMFVIAALNCGLIISVAFVNQFERTNKFSRNLDEAKVAAPVEFYSHSFPVLIERFRQRNIPVTKLTIEAPPDHTRHHLLHGNTDAYWVKAPDHTSDDDTSQTLPSPPTN